MSAIIFRVSRDAVPGALYSTAIPRSRVSLPAIMLANIFQAPRLPEGSGDGYDVYLDRGEGEFAVMRSRAVIFTPLVFLVCGIMLFVEFGENGWQAEPVAENPSFGPSVATLVDLGAKRTDLIVDNGDWWRLWTREFVKLAPSYDMFVFAVQYVRTGSADVDFMSLGMFALSRPGFI